MIKKLIPILVLFVVGLVSWILFEFLPVRKQTAKMEKRWTELIEKQKEGITENKVNDAQAEVDSLLEVFNRSLTRIYPQDRLLEFGKVMADLSKQYGLNLLSITPDYDGLPLLNNKEEDIVILEITLEFKGTFHQLSRFLDGSDQFPFFIRLDEISLEREKDKGLDLIIQTKGVIALRKERDQEQKNKETMITDRT